ncbi:MAG TPA: SDR family oxidoreductase [Bryobacteraceae bacterium]|nr:SDR family oxidoreductase [Bryobacteraceae bacterium]
MSNEKLSGKIAVITGGARGIGFAIASHLVEAGVSVAIAALRQESVDAAVTKLSQKGKLIGIAGDVSDEKDAARIMAEAARTFGGIDILINSAAIRTYKSVMDLAPADWDRMIAVNLSGPFYCTHAVLPYLEQRGGGDIVNVSSLSSTTPFAGGAGYNASKAGLNALSEATMLDHRYNNVRVTEVLPGSTDTDFNGPVSGPRPDWKVAPEDIADAVVMLLRMPRRTTVSRIDVKPSRPPRKAQ